MQTAAPKATLSGDVFAVDYESFYDSKAKYSLKNMEPYAYVRHPLFDAYLVSVVSDSGDEYVGDPAGFDWNCLSGKTLLAHNVGFDATVTERLIELGVIPDFERRSPGWLDTADLAAFLNVPRSLKDACRELLGVTVSKKARSDMDGVRWSDLDPVQRQVMIDYAADDSRLCLRLWQEHGHRWPEIERMISRVNREACMRGIRCDRAGIAEGLKTLREAQAKAAAQLPWFVPDSPKESQKPGSRPAFLMHAKSLGLPVPHSIKKDDPEMQAWVARYGDDPRYGFIKARLAYASITPHIARLEAMLERLDADDVMRFSSLYFGAHCLTGDHEVLTPDGWVRLDKWRGGEIMQWSPDTGVCAFNAATPNVFANQDSQMVEVSAPHLQVKMTLGHTVPTIGKSSMGRKFKARKAEQMIGSRQVWAIPRTGIFCGKTCGFSPLEMRLFAAVQADGHFEKTDGVLQFTLRKERKIQRLVLLLRDLSIPFKDQVFPSSPTQHRITVCRRDIPGWLTPAVKTFGPWLLDAQPEALRAFVEEVSFWDGYRIGDGHTYEYYSTGEINAQWVATIAHLSGRTAGPVSVRPPRDTNCKPGYRVVIGREGRRTEASVIPEKHVALSDAAPVVYCPTTKTGYFLVRRNSLISITGNTGRSSGREDSEAGSGGAKVNMFNIPKGDRKTGLTHGVNMRKLLLPRPGKVFGIYDFSQVEPRTAHWLAGNTAFLSRVEREDIYQAAAKVLGWYPDDKFDLKHDDPKTRDLSKACTIGLGYRMSGAKFVLTCEKMGIELGSIPKESWNLDRRAKFMLRNVAHLDFDNPADEAAVCKFLAADRIVTAWRNANAPLVNLWGTLQREVEASAAKGERTHDFVLPSGRIKTYFNPHFSVEMKATKDPETGVEETKVEKRLYASVIKGMPPASLHGGILLENITQALTRDIMFWGAMDVVRERPTWNYITNVYDEVLFELPEDDASDAEKLIPECLCRGSSSAWTKGLPLAVDGGIKTCYCK